MPCPAPLHPNSSETAKDEVDSASPPPATPERQLYAARAEIKLQLKKVRGFGSKSTTAEQRAKDSLELLMPKIKVYLDQNPDVAARKKQYMADGYRGDWPAQLPPERSPALEAFAADRKPIAAS